MPDRQRAEHRQRIEILEALVESHQQAVVALSKVMLSILPGAMKSMTDDERQRFNCDVLPLLQDVRHDLSGRARILQRRVTQRKKPDSGTC